MLYLLEMVNNRIIWKATAIQLLAWAAMVVMPPLVYFSLENNLEASKIMLITTAKGLVPMAIVYFLDFFVLAPHLYFVENKYKKVLFVVINIALIYSWNSFHLYKLGEIPAELIEEYNIPMNIINAILLVWKVTITTIQGTMVAVACLVYKNIASTEKLMAAEKEKRNAAEAELSWLKNQLNPHFLFNTLNNISSLTQIDPDKAQDSIGELSDLLRYALYETRDNEVPVAGEIEFMSNYMDLMQLRCNDKTEVEKHFGSFPEATSVAPLLFISLIENAFKHGVNSRAESFVRVSMEACGGDLIFSCENTVFEGMDTTGHSGSGIGLENLQRRLDLIYKGKYEYEHGAADGVYKAKVTLKGIVK